MGNHASVKRQGSRRRLYLTVDNLKLYSVRLKDSPNAWQVFIRDSQAIAPPIAGYIHGDLLSAHIAKPTKPIVRATGMRGAKFDTLQSAAEYLRMAYLTNKLLRST